MTFSLLVRNPSTGELGAAAATGSYCVGGWVLRGRYDSGLSASQGAAPSTIWGDEVLDRMRAGDNAKAALAATIAPDHNRGWRQFTALDRNGNTASHTGNDNGDWKGHKLQQDMALAGNILCGAGVLDRMENAYLHCTGDMMSRLIAALRAAQAAGGDRRGLKSAALLILGPDRPPQSLRIDMSENPLDDLSQLAAACRDQGEPSNYAHWTRALPVASDPYRADPSILKGDIE